MSKRSIIRAVLAALFVSVLLTGVAQALLVPHDREANPEAFLIQDYLAITPEEDEVVFVGDCEVYETFSPVVMWEECGLESRVVGSPQQLLWHSYAVLSEVLARSSPRLIVLSVYGLVYDEPQSEAYHRMVMEALPRSEARREALRAGKGEGESMLSYAIPLLRYHDRWSQLTWRDVTTLFEEPPLVSSRGYLVQTDVVPAKSSLPDHNDAPPVTDTAFGETALYWLDRIVTLCRESGVELALVKAPTDSWRYPWYDEYEQQVVALAREYGLNYFNLLSDVEEIGLDMTTDSYDGGLHLNVYGAEKTSKYFAHVLAENYELTDTRSGHGRTGAWGEEKERYRMLKGETVE